jgi:hypothetical protein
MPILATDVLEDMKTHFDPDVVIARIEAAVNAQRHSDPQARSIVLDPVDVRILLMTLGRTKREAEQYRQGMFNYVNKLRELTYRRRRWWNWWMPWLS